MYNEKDALRSIIEPTHTVGVGNYRPNPFRDDYSRILYSSAFRRLQGKAQMFPETETDVLHNRMTHSLKVSQVAEWIASSLNASDPYLQDPENSLNIEIVMAAALGHDLGHPP